MILKNGTVLMNGAFERFDIRIENGVISKGGHDLSPDEGETVIDCQDKIISPAFVDMHTHVRLGQEYKEDPQVTIRKAIKGGYCALNVMPNTKPALDCAPIVERMLKTEAPEGFHIFVTGAITNENGTLAEIEDIASAGAVAISDDGHWTENSFLFYQALKYAKKHDLLVIDHAQDMNLFKSGKIYEGKASFETGLKGFPKAAEASAIYRDGALNAQVGSRLHITHLSTLMGLETANALKQIGVHVTMDVTPHHLIFDESAYLSYDTNIKANPPFGDERDRKALVHALRSGEITNIATDHAPHSEPEKDQEWEDATYGIASIDSAFEVLYQELVTTSLVPLETLLTAMSTNPAYLLGMRHGIGIGNEANLTIIKLNEPHAISYEGGAKNNPYVGKESSAVVTMVILKGNVAYEYGK